MSRRKLLICGLVVTVAVTAGAVAAVTHHEHQSLAAIPSAHEAAPSVASDTPANAAAVTPTPANAAARKVTGGNAKTPQPAASQPIAPAHTEPQWMRTANWFGYGNKTSETVTFTTGRLRFEVHSGAPIDVALVPADGGPAIRVASCASDCKTVNFEQQAPAGRYTVETRAQYGWALSIDELR